MTENSDFDKYDKNGIYSEKCGLEKLNISFGHDEYLYQVLKQNVGKHKISKKYLDVIRFFIIHFIPGIHLVNINNL